MSFKKSFYILIVLSCIAFCRTSAAAQDGRENGRQDEDLIHFGDLIDVDVLGSLEYDWRGRLSPEGFLDGIGYSEEPVYGLCRSTEAIAADVAKNYEKLLREPKVVVRIIDRSSRAVALLEGAVKKPQRFQIRRAVRLNELIILSGGLTEQASGEIRIFRPQNLSCAGKSAADAKVQFVETSRKQGTQIFTVAVAELLKGKTEANPPILSGDIVTVSEAAPIYITGGVNNPKRISSRTQTTLSRAVDSAGGVTKSGTENSVTVFRRTNGETKIIEADLIKIKAKQAEDIPLQPYDVVDVGQKGNAKKKFAPVLQSFESNENKSGFLPLRVID